MAAELLVGDPAPPFRALAVGPGYGPDGTETTLESLLGRRLVLYFYPQNDPSGCTEQAGAIRDAWDDLAPRAALFGVSNDTPEGHRRLIEKLALPFALLSDTDNRIANAYGLWRGDGGGGDAEGGESTERSTFVIGADGRIEAVLHRVRPAEQARLLLAVFDSQK